MFSAGAGVFFPEPEFFLPEPEPEVKNPEFAQHYLMMTSLLQAVNRLDANRLPRPFIHKRDISFFNNLKQVYKYQVGSNLTLTDVMQLGNELASSR